MTEYLNIKYNNYYKKTARFLDLTDKKYNNFLVIKYLGTNKWFQAIWLCKCDCGNFFRSTTTYINQKLKISCGCKNFQEKHKNQKFLALEATYRAKASNYKATAKQRKIKWNLTIEETIIFLKSNCYYCGIRPNNIYKLSRNRQNKYKNINLKKYQILYNGIDRLNNKKGYTIENCVSCCTICNFAKHVQSYDDFIKWITRVSKHLRIFE